MPKKFTNKDKAEVHNDLSGFNINIDSFGQMKSSLSVDKLNSFLNERKAIEAKQKGKTEEE